MSLLWTVPAFPFLGFAAIVLGWRMPGRAAAWIGTAAAGLSAAASVALSAVFAASPPPGGSYVIELWRWLELPGFSGSFGLRLDALSAAMILVVTIVGFLIHLFSVAHMEGEEGYGRFFAYMNLFVGSMLLLVLADNLLLLYLGWEGVGLCSFLLIGFWYRDPANGRAARKAFIVTRIGDVSLLLGIFLLATSLGTVDLREGARRAGELWAVGSPTATLAAALVLGGALGKSAQLPLHTWLPDAMAGPSPVSALIHAATMVTAGVYLVARTNAIFALAPAVQLAVAVVGAATLVVAGASALFQRDIKRVLAYSTMSQIGYMFLALGVGAWTGGIFHLVTHAFFKSLLFLAAGVIINALHHEHDIVAMGGLAKRMPFVFWVFLAGSLGLTALPPVTAGFASKDAIIAWTWEHGDAAHVLWIAAMAGVLVTSAYTFRLLFLVFARRRPADAPPRSRDEGAEGDRAATGPGLVMGIPLAVLAFACLLGGLLGLPPALGGAPYLADFLASALPRAAEAEAASGTEAILEALSLGVSLAGIPLGWLLARRHAAQGHRPARLSAFLRGGWGFDAAYAVLVQRPFEWLARINRSDFVNFLSNGVGAVHLGLSGLLRRSQTGSLRWYVFFLAAGGALVIAAAVAL